MRCKPWGFPKRRWRFGKRRSRPISRVLSWTVIPLGATSPLRSSNLPGPDAGRAMRSLFGLAPGGVCRAGPLPDSRCALTAPFHPCRPVETVLGGIFLLHFPSACAAQALPGTVPCGARTFLGIVSNDATVWPAPPRALSHRQPACPAVAIIAAHAAPFRQAASPRSSSPPAGDPIPGQRSPQRRPRHRQHPTPRRTTADRTTPRAAGRQRRR